jgi:hypothetical protein
MLSQNRNQHQSGNIFAGGIKDVGRAPLRIPKEGLEMFRIHNNCGVRLSNIHPWTSHPPLTAYDFSRKRKLTAGCKGRNEFVGTRSTNNILVDKPRNSGNNGAQRNGSGNSLPNH